jgi:hypothetical protein
VLKGEQKEQVIALIHSDNFKALASFLDMMVKHQENQVLSHQLTVGKENELYYLKARSEGARSLYNMFLSEVAKLKKTK